MVRRMADLVRERVPVTAYDEATPGTLRLFFPVPWSFLTEVEVVEGAEAVAVALYRRVLRATTTGDRDEVDGAFLTVGTVRLDLHRALGTRRLVHLGGGDPVATLAGAARRGPFRTELLDARDADSPRWRSA